MCNIIQAREAAKILWKRGYAVICPHSNSGLMDDTVPYETFMQGDFRLIEKSDIVFFLPGWLNSEGAKREYRHAAKHDKETVIVRDISDLHGF